MARPSLDRLDRPQPRWRVAVGRLPITLSVLAIVAGGAAGLAYVASGSGVHHFRAEVVNDLGQTVEFGSCEHDDCKKGGMAPAFTLDPGERLEIGLRASSVVNPLLVTTPEAKRLGCFFLRYAKAPPRPPVISLSKAQAC
jgi:hypothetical protein